MFEDQHTAPTGRSRRLPSAACAPSPPLACPRPQSCSSAAPPPPPQPHLLPAQLSRSGRPAHRRAACPAWRPAHHPVVQRRGRLPAGLRVGAVRLRPPAGKDLPAQAGPPARHRPRPPDRLAVHQLRRPRRARRHDSSPNRQGSPSPAWSRPKRSDRSAGTPRNAEPATATVDAVGHTALFASTCATTLTARYLLTGDTPLAGTVCRQDTSPFHPAPPQTPTTTPPAP
jgi:hypothetical protein